jgi:hypothetical protein
MIGLRRALTPVSVGAFPLVPGAIAVMPPSNT